MSKKGKVKQKISKFEPIGLDGRHKPASYPKHTSGNKPKGKRRRGV